MQLKRPAKRKNKRRILQYEKASIIGNDRDNLSQNFSQNDNFYNDPKDKIINDGYVNLFSQKKQLLESDEIKNLFKTPMLKPFNFEPNVQVSIFGENLKSEEPIRISAIKKITEETNKSPNFGGNGFSTFKIGYSPLTPNLNFLISPGNNINIRFNQIECPSMFKCFGSPDFKNYR